MQLGKVKDIPLFPVILLLVSTPPRTIDMARLSISKPQMVFTSFWNIINACQQFYETSTLKQDTR